MTKDEKNLLLYLETRAVDHGGRVDVTHMNQHDFDLSKKWNDEKFISFGRVYSKDCKSGLTLGLTRWVELSEAAWKAAHDERRARAARMWAKRTWLKTEEK